MISGGSVIMIVIGPTSILRPASNTTPSSVLIESSNRSSSLFPSTDMQGCQRPSIQAGQRGGGGGGEEEEGAL